MDNYTLAKQYLIGFLIITALVIGIMLLGLLGGCNDDVVWAQDDYSDEQIVNAIYLTEGGAKAKVAYGILSVKVKNKGEARQICFNTVRNQRKRHADHKCKLDFISCLAKRYCPIGASNDPKNLNVNWLKNLKYFLVKGK